MNHRINAVEIVNDAPIGLRDFAKCYPHLTYRKCARLLSILASDGLIKRLRHGIYAGAF